MLTLDALPWDIIAIILGMSILIPSILAILLVKLRRYEDVGTIIGVFLILLATFSYFYIIPNEVVSAAILPENYFWEDEGNILYWERNTVFSPEERQLEFPLQLSRLISQRDSIEKNFIGKEVIHTVSYDKERNEMLIHDALYNNNGEILKVINGQVMVSEWYRINPDLDDLGFSSIDAGRMGIPMDQKDSNVVKVGWVESNGEMNGIENAVLVRDMQKMEKGIIDGIEVVVWQSDIYNTQITWHGEQYYCDETLRLVVNPDTGYVINVYRHLVLSARLSQFIELYYPEALKYRSINRFLTLDDPIGEAAELIYETTEESQQRHIANVIGFENQLTYLPIIICVPLFIIGLLLVWRYSGRSYYWKKYRDFEDEFITLQYSWKNKSFPKKIFAFIVGVIIISSSVGYILVQADNDNITLEKEVSNRIVIEGFDPTPPGVNRGIDSGRHILEPSDEANHRFSRREWWYFNVFFNDPNSDLYNYSMIVSFNKMAPNDIRMLRRDNLFIILYDEEGNSYDFTILDRPRGTLQSGSNEVDVTFGDSWARGRYPTWEIHAENDEKGITLDLVFTADFMPVWVMGRSSNLPFVGNLAGDYYLPRCEVSGNISWGSTNYQVSGTGYHDHIWESVVPRLVTKGWEWFNLHFDNGWEMYLSKFILRTPRNRYAGALIISPDNRNIVEYDEFSVEYLEQVRARNLPSMLYPKKYHIEAKRDNMVLKLDIFILNVCEIVWPKARTGMFEGPCIAKGSFSWDGNTVELNGYGMSEVTKVKYLLEFPNFNLKEPPAIPRIFN